MKTNDSVQIHKVANGWIVRPAPDLSNDRIYALGESYVFQTFKAMSEWLDKHFGKLLS